MENKVFKTVRHDLDFETFCIIEERSGKSTVYIKGEALPLTYKSLKEVEIMLKISEQTTDIFNSMKNYRSYN
jgi:hypothetical protein